VQVIDPNAELSFALTFQRLPRVFILELVFKATNVGIRRFLGWHLAKLQPILPHLRSNLFEAFR